MLKHIQDLTKRDKEKYLQAVKREIEKNGAPWSFYEEKIREDIDNTFDDDAFGKMDPKVPSFYTKDYVGTGTSISS